MRQFGLVKLSFLFSLILISFFSCKEDELSIGPPSSKMEGIHDNFRLIEVIQVDELSSNKDEWDVSEVYIGNPVAEIAFDTLSFTYEFNPGSALNYIGTDGSWTFDDNQFPTKIIIDTGGYLMDLPLLRTIRAVDNHLMFQVSRNCSGNNNISYKYKFERF